MVTIKGTSKIKGALDLAGIKKQLRANDKMPITDDEFADHTVQIAINMGLITYEQGGILNVGNSSLIKLRNIYDRSLRISALGDEIRPDQTFTLSEAQVNSADIRSALAKGYLEIVSSGHRTQDIVESDVNVGELLNDFKQPESDFYVEQSPAEMEEEVAASRTPRYLETNEEIFETGVIDSPTPKSIDKSEIHDPKRKSVVWNPNRDPVVHTRTHMDTVSANKQQKLEDATDIDVGGIEFVDEKLDKDRIQSHPVLKNKPESETIENVTIDFI